VSKDPKAAECVDLEKRSPYDWALEVYVGLRDKQRVLFFERLPAGVRYVLAGLRLEHSLGRGGGGGVGEYRRRKSFAVGRVGFGCGLGIPLTSSPRLY
jgi:hypothetical protein